jgi:hypothetical protein
MLKTLPAILIAIFLGSMLCARNTVQPYVEFKAELSAKEYHAGSELPFTVRISCTDGFVCTATRIFCYKANTPGDFFARVGLQATDNKDARYISAEILPWKWERNLSAEMTVSRTISTDLWPAGDYLLSVQAIFHDAAKREYYRSVGLEVHLQ